MSFILDGKFDFSYWRKAFTEVSHVVQVLAEGPKAPSPGRVELTCETLDKITLK